MEALDAIKEDGNALKIIMPAYAGRKGELNAILQYVYQAIVFGDVGKEEIGKKLMKIAADEMRHFEWLGTAIIRLGAPPVFSACPPYPVGFYTAENVNYCKNPRQMICISICGEENAIAEYEGMLYSLKNPAVSMLISRILEDEKKHLATLQEILSQLDYLSSGKNFQ